MQTRRTRAYWPTWIMLAFAIVVPAALFWLVVMHSGTMGGPPRGLGFGAGDAILAVAVCLWLTGVIWMIRIFRGPSDKPGPWRYRGR